jgi:hypothetical protein
MSPGVLRNAASARVVAERDGVRIREAVPEILGSNPSP